MPVFTYKCPDCLVEVDKLRPMSKREDPLPCEDCGGGMVPVFTVAHWNWGSAAAAHGMFIEGTRAGYHGMTHAPKEGRGGTREELLKR